MLAHFAVITPWPPQHTGIADYAFDLVWGLMDRGYKVSVICETKDPKPIEGVDFRSPEWLTEETRKKLDGIVYHIGNNTNFHIFQLPLLFKFPGVVHLHDMVLHHLMAWLLYAKGNPNLYGTVLAKWYGPILAAEARKSIKEGMPLWDSPKVADVPFFEEVLQHGTAIVTHSVFAKKTTRATFPNMPALVLPQLYREVMPRGQLDSQAFHVGIFGGITANKRLDLILDALMAVQETSASICVHIVGNVDSGCEYLIERINQSSLASITQIYGRVEQQKLLRLISAVDLCLALRYPTMGETSAIVMRALQARTQVIVSDVGWYAELPDFVPKVQPGTASEMIELTDLIVSLSSKGPKYQKMKNEIHKFVDAELVFDHAIQRYADFLLNNGAVC